jgi:hypothetical protein
MNYTADRAVFFYKCVSAAVSTPFKWENVIEVRVFGKKTAQVAVFMNNMSVKCLKQGIREGAEELGGAM